MTKKLRLMFDIDNTITKWNDNRDYTNFEPIPKMVEVINKLYDDGHHIALFTARGMTSVGPDRIESEIVPALIENLSKIGLRYHELITHKPSYDLFIDDLAIDPNSFVKLACDVYGNHVPMEKVMDKINLNNKEFIDGK